MNNKLALPPRQQISFPTVAYVRKGKPKIKVEKDGRSYEALAPKSDLGNKFRIHFLPGTAAAKAAFHNMHAKEFVQYAPPSTIPDGYEVTEIHAIVPAMNVWSAWRYGNTANNAGREIVRADNERYWTKRDPLNGKYIVKNGEPFTPFVPGEVISYDRGDKHYEIPIKSNGQLRIVCSDMTEQGQAVEFVLKTTSFYDCQQMQSQLAGIQSIADAVMGGNAAGIPLRIFRMEQEILWNHADGTATRPKSWLINIQADPAWVKFVFSKMGKMALSGGEAGYLPAPKTVQGVVNPLQDAIDTAPEEEQVRDWEEGSVVDDEEVYVNKPAASADDPTIDPLEINAVKFAAKTWKITEEKAAKQIATSNKFYSGMLKSEFKKLVSEGAK